MDAFNINDNRSDNKTYAIHISIPLDGNAWSARKAHGPCTLLPFHLQPTMPEQVYFL